VADAKSRIKELWVKQLQAQIDAGDVTVVDIRLEPKATSAV